MVSYHKTGNGSWMRCRAVKRRGQGVSFCPIEANGVQILHENGLEGIASAGGGVLRRWIADDTYRETRITPNGDGTFTAATGKRKSIFKMDGTLLSLRERVKRERMTVMNGESDPETEYADYLAQFNLFSFVSEDLRTVGSGSIELPIRVRAYAEANDDRDGYWYEETPRIRFAKNRDPRKEVEKFITENKLTETHSAEELAHVRRYVSDFYENEVVPVRTVEEINATLGMSSKDLADNEARGMVRLAADDLRGKGWTTTISADTGLAVAATKELSGHKVAVVKKFVPGGAYDIPTFVTGIKQLQSLLKKNPSLAVDQASFLKGEIELAGSGKKKVLDRIKKSADIPRETLEDIIKFWNDSISRWNAGN